MAHKECGCPVIGNESYEGKMFNWEGKTFYVQPVRYIFRVPIDVEKRMAEAAEAIEKKGYMMEEPPVILSNEGVFSGRMLVGILPPESQDPNVLTFSNSLVEATVYDRKDAPVSPGVKAFRERLEKQGKKVKDIYVWHTGCPSCIRLEGYKSVLFAELE
ncbi:MAG: hypothetical protein FJ109_04910 [Deltaproteobacteria bacterium]|nr:hypothetical protein [Deltaproteobacteria bacterium]